MAIDDTTLSAATGTGDTIRDLAEAGSSRKWPAAVCSYATTVLANANVLQVVTPANGLPVQPATGMTWAIAAAILPLPTGASTAANQAAGNASLVSLDGKVTACNTGNVTIGAPLPAGVNKVGGVTVADGDAVALGARADAAVTNPAATASVIALLKGIITELAGMLTVGGTVTANAGSGTLAVSAASLPLPTGAALEAGNLATLAGAVTGAKVNVTETNLDGSIVASAGTSAPTKGLSVLVKTNDAMPQYQPIPGGAGGRSVVVEGYAGGAAVPVSLGAHQSTNVDQWNGNTVDTNSGNKSAGTVRVVLATDQPALTNAQPLNLTQVAGAAVAQGHGAAATAVRVELPTDGTGQVNALQAGTWNVTVNTALPAGANTIGSVVNAPATAGGLTPYSYLAAGSANQDSQVVKNGAGQVYAYSFDNTTASARYVKLYDKATAPTSADTPVKRLLIPAGGGREKGYSVGLKFTSGIAFRITTGPGDSDAGAASTNDVLVNLDYA